MKQSSTLFAGLILSVVALSANASNSCEAIRFKAGSYSATVQGSVDPDGVRCYSIATGKGQTASLSIQSTGRNTIFSIDGLVDAQERYKFTTEKKTYKIFVGQMMKAVENDNFTLKITIR